MASSFLSRRSARRLGVAGLAVSLAGVAGLFGVPAASASGIGHSTTGGGQSVVTDQVTVRPNQVVATVPATAVGINTATWDSALTTPAVPGLLRQAGVRVMRFPGGSTSDQYNWETNTVNSVPQAVNFNRFMRVVRQTGAQPMVTVNYGTGNSATQSGPQLAAAWVRYANVTHHDNVKYWEIGNEVYGNGTYGATWEADNHCSIVPPATEPVNCGPAVYAQNVLQYIKAMKAVDPSIVIGVVLTAPGNWPDGVTSPGSPQPWNQTVLSILGSQIGFADVHWYPQNPSNVTPPGPSDAGLLASTGQIPFMVSTLRSELDKYSGPNVPIMVTETNSVSSNPGKQTVSLVNALFLEQDYLGWLENGVSNVDWWTTHNGIVTGSDNGSNLYGSADYGDYGVLSNGSCSGSICEPPLNTPFPAYYGMQMLHQFLGSRSVLVSATSSASMVQTYAVRKPGGELEVMVVNDSPTASFHLRVQAKGFHLTARSSIAFYGEPSASVQHPGLGAVMRDHATVPPYSITTFTLFRAGSARRG